MKIKDLIKLSLLAEKNAHNGQILDIPEELAAFMGAFKEEALSAFDLYSDQGTLDDDFEDLPSKDLSQGE
jgi:hypothetical protein